MILILTDSESESFETPEMKSFSSIVQNTCAAALAPSKIGSAIKKVTSASADDRSQNIIIYGVPEVSEENVVETSSGVLEELG